MEGSAVEETTGTGTAQQLDDDKTRACGWMLVLKRA